MHTIENPSIPFNYPIPGGMCTGSELIFTGATYNGEKKRFHINLNGNGEDVVLHLNPRFKFFEDTIVLNSRSYAGWGTEERHRNRMSVGDQFRIRIVCHHSNFLIYVNDKEVGHYEHRLSPQMVRGLEVDGDVTLKRIEMINFPQPAQAPQPQPSYAPPPPMPSYPQPPYQTAPQPSYMPPPAPWSGSPTPNAPSYRNCHHCGNRGCVYCRP